MTKESDWLSRAGSPVTSICCDMWRTGSNTITYPSGNWNESTALSPAESSTASRVVSLNHFANASSSGKSTPELLSIIFDERQRLGIVCRDSAHPRTDGKRNLDDFVKCWLAILSAKDARVSGLFYGL